MENKTIVVIDPRDASDATELAVLQDANPRSITNLLPNWLMRLFKQNRHKQFFSMPDDELTQLIARDYSDNQTLKRLRAALWDEYDRVQRFKEDKLDIDRIMAGNCTVVAFRDMCHEMPLLAFFLRPPASYEMLLKELLALGLESQRQVLLMSPTLPNGQPNTRLIDCQTKIVQHIDQRLKGAIVQRTENKNINVEVSPNSPAGQALTAPAPQTLEEIEARIQQARQQSARLSAPQRVVVDLMANLSPEPVTIVDNATPQGIADSAEPKVLAD